MTTLPGQSTWQTGGVHARADPRATAARRILAVLECRPSDDVVLQRALEVADRSGGYLTILVVQPKPFLAGMNGTGWVVPMITRDELHEQAVETLRARLQEASRDCRVRGLIVEGRKMLIVRQLVEVAAHDVVVLRRRAFNRWRLDVRLDQC